MMNKIITIPELEVVLAACVVEDIEKFNSTVVLIMLLVMVASGMSLVVLIVVVL